MYSNLSNAYGDEIRFMEIEEFDMYLQAAKDKLKPKVFNRLLKKIKFEYIQIISNKANKDEFEGVLDKYQ